jgi:NADH:ubiquinone oxidoreductase subunit K
MEPGFHVATDEREEDSLKDQLSILMNIEILLNDVWISYLSSGYTVGSILCAIQSVLCALTMAKCGLSVYVGVGVT